MKSERLRNLLQTAEHHTRKGRLSRAVTFYRKVLAIADLGDTEYELAHLRLGDLHVGLGQFDYAIVHLLRIRQIDPREPEYAFMLGRAFRLSGRLQTCSGTPFRCVISPSLESRRVQGNGSQLPRTRVTPTCLASVPTSPLGKNQVVQI